MERIVACMILVPKEWGVSDVIKRRKRLRTRRVREFSRRQSQERLIFVLLLSMAVLTHQSPERSLSVDERQELLVAACSQLHIHATGLAGEFSYVSCHLPVFVQ